MNWSLIAVVAKGNSLEVIKKGLKEFPVERVYLLAERENLAHAKKVQNSLREVPSVVVEANLSTFEGIFPAVSELKNSKPDERLVINIDSDYRTSCMMLSAAFVNGVQAIGVTDDKVIAYPIMKFSYYTVVSERKQKILQIVAREDTVHSLEYLSRETGMSLPLVTYHVRGTREKPGLQELGLVETQRRGKQLSVSITQLGRLVARGHIEQCRECPPVKKYIKTKTPN